MLEKAAMTGCSGVGSDARRGGAEKCMYEVGATSPDVVTGSGKSDISCFPLSLLRFFVFLFF